MFETQTHPEVVGNAVIAAAVNQLAETFGAPFAIWTFGNDDWREFPMDNPPGVELAESCEGGERALRATLDEFRSPDTQPMVRRQIDGRYLVIIPFYDRGLLVCLAVAMLTASEPRLVEQLVGAFCREYSSRDEMEQLRHENDAHIRQSTADFEELMFLRRMAEHLDVASVGNSFADFTEAILPLLMTPVGADALTFWMTAEESDDDVAATPNVCVGNRELSDAVCQRLIRRYGDEARQRPIVKNAFDESAEAAEFPGLRQFILISVSRKDHEVGWLLALNRAADRRMDPYASPWELDTIEFGTVEASLLDSAASMFTTHSYNVALFGEKKDLLVNVVRSMVYALDAKDRYTCGHSERVALYAQRLGRELGFDADRCDRIHLTGLLHDVGKIGVSDATLRKCGRLTDEEFEEIKRHPEAGWDILHDLDQLKHTFPGVLFHHERYDGAGYPDGLAGDDIPLEGRVIAVADAYDAMTSDRPYRDGMSNEKAIAILDEGAGTQWDPTVVETFLSVMPDILAIRANHRSRPRPKRERGGTSVLIESPGSPAIGVDLSPTISPLEASSAN